MTIRECVKKGAGILSRSGITNATEDAKLLAMYTFDLTYQDFLLNIDIEADKELADRYVRYIELRSTHYPCQYIIGEQCFMGYPFRVAEEVLILRPETEILVEQALMRSKNRIPCKTLDLCCGSGCIGISYKKKRLEQNIDDDVTLVDISREAIALSDDNANALGVKVNILRSDLFERVDDRFDMILSNPPYIQTDVIATLMEEVRDYEPILALDGHADGLYFYDRIIKEARDHLYDGGMVLFEIGYDQYEAVRQLFVDAGYGDIELIKDYAGLDRIVTARWRNNNV